ncbi:hypothetical protein PFISCL1PPCAC_21909, partial [Pristionchus fissidentatus]
MTSGVCSLVYECAKALIPLSTFSFLLVLQLLTTLFRMTEVYGFIVICYCFMSTHVIFLTVIFVVDVTGKWSISRPSKVAGYFSLCLIPSIALWCLCIYFEENSHWAMQVATCVMGVTICSSLLSFICCIPTSAATASRLLQRMQPANSFRRLPVTQNVHISWIILRDNQEPESANALEKALQLAKNIVRAVAAVLLAFLPFISTVDDRALFLACLFLNLVMVCRFVARGVFPSGRYKTLEYRPVLFVAYGLVLAIVGTIVVPALYARMSAIVTFTLELVYILDDTEELNERWRKAPKVPLQPVQQLQQA